LRRRRADRLGADTGRRRVTRDAAGGVLRRAARDRLQRRFPARRDRVDRRRRADPQADQPASPWPDPGRRRRLLVPDHADPPRRLIASALRLTNFRSYARLELDLRPGLVLAVGPNGAGKTNLLESLHVATQGFSPRTRADAQLIRFGEHAARVTVRGGRAGTPIELDLVLRTDAGKEARLNGARLRSVEQ